MGTKLKVIQKPELIVVKGREVSANGWHHYLAEQHLNWHLTQPESGKWCDVECMAKTMFRRNSPDNCMKVRKRMPSLFRVLLGRNRLMVIEYDFAKDGHGKIIACKLFEASTAGMEHQHALTQLERMQKRMMLSQELRERMVALIGV
jgi:hypothetical protein